MCSLISELSAMRVVVMVDAISLRVGRCRIAPEDLFQIFREVLLPGQPGYCAKDTRGGLYTMWKLSPRHSPGTCRPSELSSALQSFVVDLLRHICTWPLGLKPSCFLSNHCSCWHLVPTKPDRWLSIFHTPASAMVLQPDPCRARPRPWMFLLFLRPL